MELPKEQTTTIYLCGGIKLGTLWVKNQLFQTFWHFWNQLKKLIWKMVLLLLQFDEHSYFSLDRTSNRLAFVEWHECCSVRPYSLTFRCHNIEEKHLVVSCLGVVFQISKMWQPQKFVSTYLVFHAINCVQLLGICLKNFLFNSVFEFSFSQTFFICRRDFFKFSLNIFPCF